MKVNNTAHKGQEGTDLVTHMRRMANWDVYVKPSGLPTAAVLIPVTSNREDPAIVFTRRSAKMSSHAGEVAFPGGKTDLEDTDVWATALRESNEEIGLVPSAVEKVGKLVPYQSRWGLEVTPCVGIIPQDLSLSPQSAETESVFHVPIKFLLQENPTPPRRFTRGKHEILMPTWHFQDYEIWGLTAMMTAQFLNIAFNAGIKTVGDSLTAEPLSQ